MILFNFENINALSKRICEDFATGFPPELQTESTVRAKRQLNSALNGVDQNLTRFLATKPRIGVFRKAKCANEVKWGLRERGYKDGVVTEVVRKVVFGLSMKIGK